MRFVSCSTFVIPVAVMLAAFAGGCDDDAASPDDGPSAAFTISGEMKEGSILTFENGSTGATSFQWTSAPAGLSSTENDPEFAFLREGTYVVRLVASGNGRSDTATQTITIGRDNFWRATGGDEKIWYLNRTEVGSTDVTADPCYWDNTLTFRADGTFTGLDGSLSCDNDPLPPEHGTFQFNDDFTQFTIIQTEPTLETFGGTVVKLTADTLIMNIPFNSVMAAMTLTTTRRQ